MVNNILLATGNPHKQEMLEWMVRGFFNRVDTPDSCGVNINVVENESTFVGNASRKAKSYSKFYDGYVISTDGGVSIPALGEKWDALKTKRFAGPKATDQDRIKLLLEMMASKEGDERKMSWREAVAIAYKGQCVFSAEVEGVTGVLQNKFDETRYQPGIWVCSVWYFPELGKNYFDMTDKERSYVEQSWHKLRRLVRKFMVSED